MSIKNMEIGGLEIYEESIHSGRGIFSLYEKQFRGENVSTPLLMAEMQQGKTNVIVYSIHYFKEKFFPNVILKNNPNAKYEIFILNNISDNELRSQTRTRIFKAGLEKDVTVFHHAEYNSIKPNEDSDVYRLIVIDEAHTSITKGDKKPFAKFMKLCGVDYGNPLDQWENKKNFVLSVSATPWAHMIKIKKDIDDKVFTPIKLEKSPDYYSLEDLRHRIKPNEKIYNSRTRVFNTSFFKKLADEFITNCGSGGGHFVIRAQGNTKLAIRKHVREKYPELSVRIFGTGRHYEEPISELAKHLESSNPNPCITIIAGSLRAGKTLETTRNLRLWLETSITSKSDALGQSAGRLCGYEMVDGYNRRKDDDFSFYCKGKEIDTVINFFNSINKIDAIVPSGNNNSECKVKKMYNCTVFSGSTKEEVIQIADLQGKLPVSTISRYNTNDVADYIYKNVSGKSVSKRFVGRKGEQRLYHFDSSNSYFEDSYSKLLDQFPELEGKFIFLKFDETEELVSGEIKDKCLFS